MSSLLEHLIPGDWETVRRNFERTGSALDLISSNADGFGFSVAGIGVRFGAATLTWPGASLFSNASFVVAHGLGKTPSFAGGTPIAPAGGFVFEVHPELVNATNVQWRARTLDGTTPGAATTKDFYWLVIG